MPDHPNPYPPSDLGLVLERVDTLRDELREHRRETRDRLDDLTTEVRTTNGRVRKLEMWQAGLQAVKAALSWRVPLIVGITSSVISGVVVGVVLLAIGGAT